MNSDFEWFVENYPTFQEQYGDCVLAIKDRQILGVYPNVSEAYHTTKKD